MKTYLSFFIINIFFLFSCSEKENPLIPPTHSDFSIFLLQDSNITFQEAENQGLNNVKLKDVPWLSINDILMYDFSTHYIYLNKNKESLFEDMIDNNHIFADFLVKPFVLIAGNQRIYLGSFLSSLSSIACAGPHIGDLDQLFFPSDVLEIKWCNIQDLADPRNDSRIEEALKQGNIFHAGLDLSLIDIEIIENSDTSSIEYSFSIKNNDEDDLLVPDPDLMGTELFHYYTNGIDFWSSNQGYYYSQYKSLTPPVPANSWNANWFVKLKSGESIERTVFLRGYPKFPKDTYDCYFKFAGPNKIDLNERINQDGRFWIGSIQSNTMSITI